MTKLKTLITASVLAVTVCACSRDQAALEIPTGSEVTVQKKDGVTVAGRLVEIKPESVVIESRDGVKLDVPRAQITKISGAPVDPAAAKASETKGVAPVPTSGDAASPATRTSAPLPEYREVVVPAGTVLPLELRTSVGSDTSKIEDRVTATVRRDVKVQGLDAIPAGTTVLGHVTDAKQSARVKGRARIAFRFTELDLPGDSERVAISTGTVAREAAATKKKDATIIGGGAGAGAVIGGLIGGGDGAAKGAAIGGAAGSGTVLATRGKEVRLGPGAQVSVKLTSPVTLRVALNKTE